MVNLKTSAGTASNGNSFSSATAALNSMDFATQIAGYKGTMSNIVNMGNDYVGYISTGFTVYYAAECGFVALMVLGTLAFACCGCLKCRCLSHLGWILSAFLMIIGFLLGTILFPVSVVLMDMCTLLPLSSMATIGPGLFSSQWSQISVCLVGNGDLYTQYNLGAQLGFINSTSSAMNMIANTYDPVNDKLIYNISDAFVANCQIIRDSTPDQAAPNTFKSNNLMSSANSNCKKDQIVWTSSNCTGTAAVIQSPNDPNGVCIPLKAISSFSSTIGSRYSAVFSIFSHINSAHRLEIKFNTFINSDKTLTVSSMI
jgi:hypothetical protein